MFSSDQIRSDWMADWIAEAQVLVSKVMESLEPGAMSGGTAAAGVELFSRLEKLASAGKAMCAARVADSGHWRSGPDRTAAHWLARVTGSSMGDARSALEVAGRLRNLPATDAAMRSGDLSLDQAQQVSAGATADPDAEAELLDLARREALAGLRAASQRVQAAACADPEERHRRIHRSRYLRHHNDATGSFRLDASLTPEAGAEVLAALAPVRQRLEREARRNGRCESREALAADALVEMCRPMTEVGSGERARARFVVNLRVDERAWTRGRTQVGEICEIDGAGPVPVSVAQALAEGRSFADDPAEVAETSTNGRHIPAALRRALLLRDPTCVIAGCYQSVDLEIDHIEPFANGGPTSLSNLCRLCRHHHHLKTKGWKLTGKGNSRQLLPEKLLERTLTPI